MSALQGIYPHLAELKKRITRIVISVGAIIMFLLTFRAQPFWYDGIRLYYPTPEPLHNIAAQIVNHMRTNLVPPTVQLIQTAPGQAFYAQVYVATLVGIVLSMPIIVRELTKFIAPAMSEKEAHAIQKIAIPAIILFVAGASFICYSNSFHVGLLYQYGQTIGVTAFFDIMEFVTFVLQFLLAFGVSFQLPLIMYAATLAGITDAKFWRNNFRYAIVALIVIGAVVTPDGSGITMWFISGPMIALYVIGIIIIERHERKELAKKSHT